MVGGVSWRSSISRAAIIGVVDREIIIEKTMASDRVMANSRKYLPTMPPISRIGMNTAIREMLIDRTVKPTSFEPSRAAFIRGMPLSTWRVMFSRTTMASSTTKPVATVRAIRDRLSRLKPIRYIRLSAPNSDTTTATAGISVALPLCRNSSTTTTTSTTAISRVRSTSASEARMVRVRSMETSRVICGGISARTEGSSALMRSTTETMLAPGWRVTWMITAGLPLNRPRL